MARLNRTLTIAAGTYTRLSDFATAATAGEILPPLFVKKFFAQMLHGGAGVGYIMMGIPNGITPNPATDGQLTAELSPATGASPGGSISDFQNSFGSMLGGVNDLTRLWVGGANTGDKMVVSYETEQ